MDETDARVELEEPGARVRARVSTAVERLAFADTI